MNTFTHNLELLTRRHPELGRYLAAIAAKEKVASVRTEDGAHCFVRALPDGKWQALTSTEEPLRKAQAALDAMEGRLERGLAPAVIAGLQAGLELDAIFNSFLQNFHQKQIPRRIIVITESPLVLLAWLHHRDRSEILDCPLVEWYRPGADLDALIRRMEEDDCLSHNFAPVSSLPQGQIEALISPLTRIYLKRLEQERGWRSDNELYYRELGDAELSRTLAGCTLVLYGRGWERHPRFGRWAKGVVAHGPELGRAFRKSRFALHLNPNEGSHQRLSEIIAAGAVPLLRRRPAMHLSRVYARLLHAAAQGEASCVSYLPRLAKILDLAPHWLSSALNDHLDLVLWGEDSPVFNSARELPLRLKNPPQPPALSHALLAFSGEQLIRQLGGRQLTAAHWLSLLSGLSPSGPLPAPVQAVIAFDSLLQARPLATETPEEEPCSSLIRLLRGEEVPLPLKTSVDSDRLANLLYHSCLAGATAGKPDLFSLSRRLVLAWPQAWQETRLFQKLLQQLDSLIAEAAP